MALDSSTQLNIRKDACRLFKWIFSFVVLCQSAFGWSALSPLPSGKAPTSVSSGFFSGSPDFPGVAITDAALAGNAQLFVYLNNNGSLAPAQSPFTVSTSPTYTQVAAGNFQQAKSVSDLAVTLQSFNQVLIYLNDGSGTFTKHPTPLSTGKRPISIAIGNFKGNRKGDIVVANAGVSATSLSIFFSNGDGTFSAPTTINLLTTPTALAVGDLNGDGFDDIAVAHGPAGQVSVYLNDGAGTFTLSKSYAVGANPLGIAIGSLANSGCSGCNDIAVACTASNELSILLNKGSAAKGQFADAVKYKTEYAPFGVTIADFAGNGKKSVAVANEASSTVNVFVNNGDGTFQNALSYATCCGPISITSGSFAGANNYTYFNTCLFNGTTTPSTATSTATSLAQSSATTNVGESVTFTATVTSSSGVPTGNVSFSIDGGLGTIVPLTATGQAVFTTTSLTSGNHQVTATYLGTSTVGSSTGLFPSSASVNHQVVQPQPPIVIYPPRHVLAKQEFNRFATQVDIVNVLTWKAPKNGTTPVEYRIYRNAELTKLAGSVRASHTTFSDHNRRKKRSYTYYIVSVDASGTQSSAVSIKVSSR